MSHELCTAQLADGTAALCSVYSWWGSLGLQLLGQASHGTHQQYLSSYWPGSGRLAGDFIGLLCDSFKV